MVQSFNLCFFANLTSAGSGTGHGAVVVHYFVADDTDGARAPESTARSTAASV